MQILTDIIRHVFDVCIFILLLRFILQKLQASWYNPVTKIIASLTNPVVNPARHVIPGYKGFDWSIIGVAVLAQIFALYIMGWMRFGVTFHFGAVLFVAAVTLLSHIATIFLVSVVIWAFFTWFTAAQYNPVAEITGLISHPLLTLTRRFVPLIYGLDLSPAITVIGLSSIISFILDPLLRLGMQLALT